MICRIICRSIALNLGALAREGIAVVADSVAGVRGDWVAPDILRLNIDFDNYLLFSQCAS